jgi:hypothetical protein
MNLAFQHHPFGQERNVVVSSKTIISHASFPLHTRSIDASIHHSSS